MIDVEVYRTTVEAARSDCMDQRPSRPEQSDRPPYRRQVGLSYAGRTETSFDPTHGTEGFYVGR